MLRFCYLRFLNSRPCKAVAQAFLQRRIRKAVCQILMASLRFILLALLSIFAVAVRKDSVNTVKTEAVVSEHTGRDASTPPFGVSKKTCNRKQDCYPLPEHCDCENHMCVC